MHVQPRTALQYATCPKLQLAQRSMARRRAHLSSVDLPALGQPIMPTSATSFSSRSIQVSCPCQRQAGASRHNVGC